MNIVETGSRDTASPAREARDYLRTRRHGVLSTLSRAVSSNPVSGYPYGSVVPFALDHEARPVILISRLAEHTRNLEADPRASLLVRDDGDDVQAGARLALLGDAARIEAGESLRARFLRYRPAARQTLELGDFSFWRITPKALRFIAGFGAIRWVPANEYAIPSGALAEAESDIVARVNAEDSKALHACCVNRRGREAKRVAMLGIDCEGFDVLADGERLRFSFQETAADADAARRALVQILGTQRRS